MGVYLYPNNTETPLKNAYIGIPFPTSIVLDKSVINLTNIGDTAQLTATIEPTVSDKSITWTTSDPTVATVSPTGLVTCVTPGECTITATTVNGLTASCSVDDNQGWQPGVNTIAYYALDGDATDATGNYDGTASNVTYTTLASGIQVATFNGNDSMISIADPLVNNLTTFTVSVWFNITASRFGDIINNQSSVYNGVMMDSIDGTQFRGGVGGGGADGISTTMNSWHNGILTYNNGSVLVYLDGVQGYADNHTYANGTNMTIGAWILYNRYWAGYISKVIFEDKTWTSQEISAYYNQTKSLYGIS